MNLLQKTINNIEQIDYSLAKATQNRLDNLTKPQGSLGILEDLAKQVVEISKQKNPKLKKKVVFTFAADHGIVEEGVSAFPQEVTPQMVLNFLNSGAGINVLAKHVGAKVIVADLGMKAPLDKNTLSNFNTANFKEKRTAAGTKNFSKEKAMSKEEAICAIEAGIAIFEEEYKNGIDIAGTGEMGIGNTTSASAITAVITKQAVQEVTGKGTGIDEKGLTHKIAIIEKALKLHQIDTTDGLDVLSKIGGFEIAGLVGVILSAARRRVPIVIDGFISASAALVAYVIEPKVKDYMFGSHNSVEKGQQIIMNFIGVKPLFDFNFRLGEGTGAALAFTIIEAGVKILNEMATFASAGVSNKE